MDIIAVDFNDNLLKIKFQIILSTFRILILNQHMSWSPIEYVYVKESLTEEFSINGTVLLRFAIGLQ